ncbi:hypothetical protein BBJ28_00013661 [Nothophytophthora sp. Chile5]|nr:hypothetical protein BBJ28_00013661 [Nothophytophthora sp. Chile5]
MITHTLELPHQTVRIPASISNGCVTSVTLFRERSQSVANLRSAVKIEELSPRIVMDATSIEHASMRAASAAPPVGYWGPPSSTIDWCETNYEHSYYIAEFWNTVSNSLFVLLGLYGLYRSIKMGFEPRFHAQFVGIMITGFGSAMFHGTLQNVYVNFVKYQQCDETPMVWTMLTWIYITYNKEISQIPIKHASGYMIAFLTTIGVVFTVVHAIYRFTTMFQLFFGVLAVLCCGRLSGHYATVKDPRARAVARSYVTTSLIGFAFWLMDYHYCHTMRGLPVNPQGHAWYVHSSVSCQHCSIILVVELLLLTELSWMNYPPTCRWHVFMGIATYHGPIFMQYVRMEQLNKKVRIHDTWMGIETIVVEEGEAASPKKPKSL